MKEYSKLNTDFSWKNTAVEFLKQNVDKILSKYFMMNTSQGEGDYISQMAASIAEDMDDDILNFAKRLDD